MASLQGLLDDVMGWLNRRDVESLIPGWVRLVETEIAETCRTRFQVTFGTQSLDAPYITMPPSFAAMESIRDAWSGELLHLVDEWSGAWSDFYSPTDAVYAQVNPSAPARSYRLTGDCVEFLPHPVIPDPPSPTWVPQSVIMGWYMRPLSGYAPMKALEIPSDTNPILENLYGIYLFGICKIGAMFELDDDRAQQMDAQYQQVVTRANLWKQQSDYSGAPFRAELVGF